MDTLNIFNDLSLSIKQKEEFERNTENNLPSVLTRAYTDEYKILHTLKQLLYDEKYETQENSTNSVSKLSNISNQVAEKIVNSGIIQRIILNIEEKTGIYKITSMCAIRILCQYSTSITNDVVNYGGLQGIFICLHDNDPQVKIAALWALNSVVQNDNDLAVNVVRSGVLNSLSSELNSEYLHVKIFSALVITTLSIHSSNVVEYIVESTCVYNISKYITHTDQNLQGLSLSALSNLCLRSIKNIKSIVTSEFLIDLINLLKHEDVLIKKCSTTMIKEITIHSLEFSEILLKQEVIQTLLKSIQTSHCCIQKLFITSLGNVGSLSKNHADMIVHLNGHYILSLILYSSKCERTLMAASWSLINIGKHSTELTNCIANTDAFQRLIDLYKNKNYSQDLKNIICDAIKNLLPLCDQEGILRHCFLIAPEELLTYFIEKYNNILMRSIDSRRIFYLTGGIKKIINMDTIGDFKLKYYISIIKQYFPDCLINTSYQGITSSTIELINNFTPDTLKLKNNIQYFSDFDHFPKQL